MKKIIRLTESDLIRLVKRVINEQTTPSTGIGKLAAKQFVEALSKFNNDEAGALKAISQLKNNSDFIEFKNQIKIITGKEICSYFASKMSEFDYKEFDGINRIINNLSNKEIDCANNDDGHQSYSHRLMNAMAKSVQGRN
jgi:hypothetical protein